MHPLPAAAQTEGRRQIHCRAQRSQRHNPGTDRVQVVQQQIAHQPSHQAFYGHGLEVPVPGQQSQHGGAERDQSKRPAHPHPGILHRVRTHPAQGHQQQHYRQQEGHQAQRLQHKVRAIAAHRANPVVRLPHGSGGVQRAVQRGVRGQRQQHQRRGGHKQQADQLVEPLALRRDEEPGERGHNGRPSDKREAGRQKAIHPPPVNAKACLV